MTSCSGWCLSLYLLKSVHFAFLIVFILFWNLVGLISLLRWCIIKGTTTHFLYLLLDKAHWTLLHTMHHYLCSSVDDFCCRIISVLFILVRNVVLWTQWQFFVGPKPKVSENAFEDLLGGHSFSGKKEPKTMKELRKNMDVRDMSPDQRKVLLMCFVIVKLVYHWCIEQFCLIKISQSCWGAKCLSSAVCLLADRACTNKNFLFSEPNFIFIVTLWSLRKTFSRRNFCQFLAQYVKAVPWSWAYMRLG